MSQPIVLIDSGVGGLTVLKSIVQRLPNQKYIYIADNAYFPYGTKTFEQLRCRLQQLACFVKTLSPKAVVIACNTASVHCDVFQSSLQCPVVDVITPTCAKVLTSTQNKKVCLLATDATICSQRYQQILCGSGVQVIGVPCSDFVPIVELGQLDTTQAIVVVQNKLQPFVQYDFDTVILGCTHFGLLQKQISQVLGVRKYIQCAQATAQALDSVLQNDYCYGGGIKLLTTGHPTSLMNVSIWLNLDVTQVVTIQLPIASIKIFV